MMISCSADWFRAAFHGSRKQASAFFPDQSGATSIEYSLIAVLVSIFIIGAVTAVGVVLRDEIFNPVSEKMIEASETGSN